VVIETIKKRCTAARQYEGKFSNLSWKSSRTPVSLLWLYRFMMEAFVRPQNRRRFLEKRFDYLALVPAAAAICYPFLLNAFHAIVGTQAVSPLPLAIASATFILVVAFVVPFLGIALARPTSIPVQDASPMPAWCRQRSMSFPALSRP
jgi:hypothetical protein